MIKEIAEKIVKENEGLVDTEIRVSFHISTGNLSFSKEIGKSRQGVIFDGGFLRFDSGGYPNCTLSDSTDVLTFYNDVKFYCKTFQKRYDEILSIIDGA